ncbi:glycosyltransferase [Sphingobium fuliginis]|jgi:glycosyltransferase involved in cell wall biosynthesis|uniref:Glycosyltransferase n=2 Tax=Sphingobium fuliginis (strain ATCC 27551) TaxID=336203 RepID=A0A7M2GDE2_SPHSA|nr:glycosyltransferase [Sphingobium fuliginis]QOT70724.1 glycosyltransferase [Sphingobium fuliginis]
MTAMNGKIGQWAKPRLSVHIVISDTGWILERLAKEIADRLPYVTYGRDTDPTASIQYYITYGCRGGRISPIEIALFTHREEDAATAARFDAAALEVDHAIAMSRATLKLIDALGVSQSSCIMPGVDIDAFRPKIKIAVVGRTYHTGRKGEALVRAVMDVPDIEWHFTGEGWPGMAEHIDEVDLPAFYQSMDYILVPALNEGGPMSVLEALASGVEVIASDVGWVSDFPHIPFKNGDAASLRTVLMRLRDERMKLRASVEHVTWDRWASEHDKLFCTLFQQIASPSLYRSGGKPSKTYGVSLVTHGFEDTTLGGPSRRVPATAQALRSLSVAATALHDRIMPSTDIVHGFNIWHPKTALRVAREAKRLNKPLVFSPIFLDLSEAPLWQADIFRAFRRAESGGEAETMVRHYAQIHRERSTLHPSADPEPGYRDMATEIAELADALIYLSESERNAFKNLVGDVGTSEYLVRNPVDATHFQNAPRDLFREAYGLQDYVVCVARVEPRKNQLMLVNALRDSDLPIVLIGHEAHPEYADLIRRFGGPGVVMIDRLEPNSDMLRSAIAGARVFVLPSWAEGAPLTALEAAATGANMVLSDRSGECEYIGDRARYCDPSCSDSLRDAVREAWDEPITPAQALDLANHVKEQFSWEKHVQQTRAVYDEVLHRFAEIRTKEGNKGGIFAAKTGHGDIILDVTTWANNANMLSGIVRVERSIGAELIKRMDLSVRFVFYHSNEIGFIEIPREVIIKDILNAYMVRLMSQKLKKKNAIIFSDNSNIISVGSSWMLNSDYAMELAHFARGHKLTLTVLMHDMTPALFPHWYEGNYGERWERNCAIILEHTNRLLVYSESTRRDVSAFAEKYDITMPTVAKIRLADEVGTFESKSTPEGMRAQEFFRSRPFVLSVGGIHLRKNYGLLYDVWLILRERMGDACPHLVIVGGVSWNGAETARVMRDDPKVNSHIHILDNIDDSSLDWLYDKALMTAYPSLYEGWGLPVGESLAHGKICLSSNRSSMKEIAPDLTDLIDPFDRIRWASMIQHYSTSSTSRATREAEIRENFTVTSWSETTDHIVEALAAEMKVRAATVYNLGDVALVGNHGEGASYLPSGWYGSEVWGRWAKSTIGTIELRFAHVPDEDVVLTVLAKVLKPSHERLRYEVRANDRVVGLWEFPPVAVGEETADLLINRVVIPQEIINKDDCLVIEMIGDHAFAVREVFHSFEDARRLGIGLSAFMVERRSQAGDAAILFSTREDIRAALQVEPSVDLPRRLTETIHRPSVTPDERIHDFRPFCRIGSPYGGDGVHAQNNCLNLAFGVARLRFDRPVRMQFVIDAPHASPGHPMTITLFVNDHCVSAIELQDDIPTVVDVEIPTTLLTESDPLYVSLFEAGGKKAGKSDFFVSMMSFSQDMLLPSQKWPLMTPGQFLRPGSDPDRQRLPDQMLCGGWHNPDGAGIWSLADAGRICFSVDPDIVRDGVLLLDLSRMGSDRQDDSITILANGGAKIAEAKMPGGTALQHRILVPLDAAANSRGEVDIRLIPNNPNWPSRSEAHPDYRRFGVQLLGLELRTFDGAGGKLLMLDGWHDWEPDGRWSAASSVTFAFRTRDVAQAPVIHAEVLPGSYGDVGVSLHYAVNDEASLEVQVIPGENQEILLPLIDFVEPGIHRVSLSGIEPVSPMSLGLNEDPRPLGIRLNSVSFGAAREIMDNGWEGNLSEMGPAEEVS